MPNSNVIDATSHPYPKRPEVTEELKEFIKSRAPLIEYDLNKKRTISHRNSSIQHAFFYRLDTVFKQPKWISSAALEHLASLLPNSDPKYWKNNEECLWNLTTHKIHQIEKKSRKESAFILEHITTGGMVINYLTKNIADNKGILNVDDTAKWLCKNYQIACILRKEDSELNKKHKSDRGASLKDALGIYANLKIQLITEEKEFKSCLETLLNKYLQNS